MAAQTATTTVVIDVPEKRIGLIIGTGGARVAELKRATGTHIHIEGPGMEMRKVTINGPADGVATAEGMINGLLSSGGSGHDQRNSIEVMIEDKQVGIIIGRGGAHIRELQARAGAQIYVDTETESMLGKKRVRITGNPQQIERAERMVEAVLAAASTAEPGLVSITAALDKFEGLPESCATTAASAAADPEVSEELLLSDAALALLTDPMMPGPLAQLRASAVHIHFAREPLSLASAPPPELSQPQGDPACHEACGSSAAVSGAQATEASTVATWRVVRMSGAASAVQMVQMIFASLEAHAKAEKAATAMQTYRPLGEEEALYRYYRPYFDQASLPYAPPARLWQDEVDAEAARYRMWAAYYADGHGAAAAGAAAGGSSALPLASALSSKDRALPRASADTPAAQGQTAAGAAAAGTVQREQLPAGWSTALDAATGRTYYMHLEKVLTQWEKPTE